MQAEEVISRLKGLANPENVEGMARFGINSRSTLGISLSTLRPLAREMGKDHGLAQQLWDSGIHEARILASIIGKPAQVTEEQMEAWVGDLDSWDVCDQVCMNLWGKSPYAYQKAHEWSTREEEFVKRAAFALMVALAIHDKKASDERLEEFFPVIKAQAPDNRNFVRKAVNWALRQIGKRNLSLNRKAIAIARQILDSGVRPARWVASDALRELTSEKIQSRLRSQASKPRQRRDRAALPGSRPSSQH